MLRTCPWRDNPHALMGGGSSLEIAPHFHLGLDFHIHSYWRGSPDGRVSETTYTDEAVYLAAGAYIKLRDYPRNMLMSLGKGASVTAL